MEFQAIYDYAQEFDVPIIEQDTWSAINQIIQQENPKIILEIGSAIGYSSLLFAKHSTAHIVTIEKDPVRAALAAQNISESAYATQIEFYEADAFTWEYDGPAVDILFIDAAKAQNKAFFERFAPLVRPGGIILTDNMNFRGFADMPLESIKSRNLKRMVRRTKEYRQWLQELDNYTTSMLPVGDGLAVTIKE